MTLFLKDPAATLVHAVDWGSDYLAGRGITQSDWAVAPAGLALANPQLSGGRTGISISGGVAGTVYRISNLVTLSDGQRDERSLTLRVEER